MEKIKRIFWTVTWQLLALGMVALAIALSFNSAERANATDPIRHPLTATQLTSLSPVAFGQPIPPLGEESVVQGVASNSAQGGSPAVGGGAISQQVSNASVPAYTPREELIAAHPSNYGPRYITDIYGNGVNNAPIVVIHETVGSASSAINLFQRNHTRDADQVSYHSLIKRDGTIVHLVHPQMRAFGAGNSVFDGPNGPETVRTHPDFPASVNNFAYHTSLESPGDGRGNQSRHSGYTAAQYQSLAWIVARLPVPDNRITTHQRVDRSGSRRDPRSFDFQRFLSLLHAYSQNAAADQVAVPQVALFPQN
ncbi:MAG: peptidoglycan recognition family protein [Elainellaceae cyanobacterium]